MKQTEVSIAGRKYPCYATCGASLRFKRKTRKEMSEAKLDDTEDVATVLWCVLKSACSREGVPFEYADEQELMDHLLPEDMRRMVESITEEAPAEGKEKKSLPE